MSGPESNSGNGHLSSYPHVSASGGGVVQLELGLGKNAIMVMWMSCVISAIAVVGLVSNYSAYKTVSAKYEVLQYDHQALKAQLVAAGVYQGTEH